MMRRMDENDRAKEQIMAALVEVDRLSDELELVRAKLRENAAALRDGSKNPHHVANSLDKLAREMFTEKVTNG